MMIICISPFFVGVSIFLSVSASYFTYQRYYGARTYPILCFSILNACVPLGGVMGSLTFPILIRNVGKMNIVFYNFIASLICCSITLAPYFWVMIFGRFLLGIACSWCNTLGAILLRDITPLQYRGFFGAMFFMARVVGITFSLIIGYIFFWVLDDLTFCLINMMPVYIAMLQWIFFKLFIKQNPADYSRTDESKIKPYMQRFYAQQDVDQAVQNCIREYKKMQVCHSYIHKGRSEQQKELANKIYQRIMDRTFITSCQVSSIRQISGVNYITLYAQVVFQALGFSYSASGPIIVNIVQILSTFLGMFLCHKFGRRPMLMVGLIGSIATTFTMGIANLFENYVGVLTSIVIYMVFAGAILQPVAWPYPPQILPIIKIPRNNVSSWVSSTIVASLPILLNSYPYFFFFSGFMLVNLFILYFTVAERKNITLKQLLTQFMKKAYEQVQKKHPEIILKNKKMHSRKTKRNRQTVRHTKRHTKRQSKRQTLKQNKSQSKRQSKFQNSDIKIEKVQESFFKSNILLSSDLSHDRSIERNHQLSHERSYEQQLKRVGIIQIPQQNPYVQSVVENIESTKKNLNVLDLLPIQQQN